MLSLRHVSKSFGGRAALSDVSIDVARGRLTGFVGGNGAGKTTAMRIALGVLASDSGTVTLDGAELTDRHGFGYMPEERGLYPKMEVHAQLVYLARLHGVPKAAASTRASELLERLGLGERAHEKLETLSLGNQQRVQIAAALVHSPDVLVLDEPFSGLDPLAVDEVVAVLAEQAARGIPVLFSSHQLDVVERLCDDLVIIAAGRIREAGSREELRRRNSSSRWTLETWGDTGWVRGVPGLMVNGPDRAGSEGADPVTNSHGGGSVVTFTAGEALAQEVLRLAVERGGVRRFAPQVPTLAEIFRDIVVDHTTNDGADGAAQEAS